MSKATASTRTPWRGVMLEDRTRKALVWAERKSGVKIVPTQGSFSSSVAASGSTHKGAGAVDIRSWHLTKQQRIRLVHALKDAGFAAWYRTADQGFAPHIHAILIGGGKDGTADIGGNSLSSGAAWQVREYDAGRSGLTSSRRDPTYRPSRRRFSWKQGKPVER